MPAAGEGVANAWRQGAAGGGWGRSGGGSPPVRATSSGRKYLVAISLYRILKFFTSPSATSQHLAEDLIELLMYELKEGGGGGGLLA